MEEKISFIIPTRNEQEIAGRLDYLSSFLKEYSYEILLVDDSDPGAFMGLKQELEIKKDSRIKLIAGDHNGKGGAVRKGILNAQGSIIFYLDADFRIPLNNIELFINLIRGQGNHAVIAERPFNKTPRTLTRLICSAVLFLIVRVFVFHSRFFYDTQCGFKAFRRVVLKEIAKMQIVSGGMFDIEYLYIARYNKLKIAKVYVLPLAEIRRSKINLLRCMFCDLVDLFRIKIKGALGAYKLK